MSDRCLDTTKELLTEIYKPFSTQIRIMNNLPVCQNEFSEVAIFFFVHNI